MDKHDREARNAHLPEQHKPGSDPQERDKEDKLEREQEQLNREQEEAWHLQRKREESQYFRDL